MTLVIIFDKDIDIIDVPQSVIDNKDNLKKKFLHWVYNKNNKKYRKQHIDKDGKCFYGVMYRSDAFVYWLNKKVLFNNDAHATVLIQHTNDYPNSAPTLFF